MKILYLSDQGDRADYLRDCVANGMRSLLGPAFIDVPRLDVLYKDFPQEKSIYGRGFSLYRLLPEILVDRTDIEARIKAKDFDIVMYSSIHRSHEYLKLVADTYDPRRVVFLDGEDHPGYLQGLGGIYFKRELHNGQPNVWPIHFAIPEEKILKEASLKTRLLAPCDPLNRETYVYKDESSYYAQYAASYYGATMKKAGWDCLRHYEILSQWCLPYFRVMEQLPSLICHNLPRAELRVAQLAFEYFAQKRGDEGHQILIDLWHQLMPSIMKTFKETMTTTALARYVLNTVGVREKEASFATPTGPR